jgi:hypothetical protein
MRQLVSAAAAIFLSKGSEYISNANDTEILTRWALTALFGCSGMFFLLGWALGNALYAMPAMLYVPGLCSIPIIIAAPSLAVVYPYYHQCIANPLVSIISALLATIYLFTISTSSSNSPERLTHFTNSNVLKWRMQSLILCILLVFTSLHTISDCLRCGRGSGTSCTSSGTEINDNKNNISSHRTTGSVSCIWRCPLQDGSVLSIIENSPEDNPVLRYRVMRLNHAVMGGIWILPEREAGRPVYTTFHLQAAARLLLNNNINGEEKGEKRDHREERNSGNVRGGKQDQQQRSLHIGLGAGTAVQVLQQRGFMTDVVELYQEIIDAAQSHFGLILGTIDNSTTTSTSNVTGGTAFVGDALKVVPSLKNNVYDVVILDVFSGGFSTSSGSTSFFPLKIRKKEEPTIATELSSAAFFQVIKQKMKQDSRQNNDINGVLAVNYVGMQDSTELAQLVCTLKQVFTSVRYFRDTAGEVDEDDRAADEEKGKEAAGNEEKRRQSRKKHANKLNNFVIMATDNTNTNRNSGNASKAGANGNTVDLFSASQREILKLGDGPLDEMEVDVLSRLAKNELPVGWATEKACEGILAGGDGDGNKGAAQRAHQALTGLHNAAAHWRTMRVQFGDEVWTL